jgi:hypothetical protein
MTAAISGVVRPNGTKPSDSPSASNFVSAFWMPRATADYIGGTHPHTGTLLPTDTSRFRATLVRVMAVQLLALILLGVLQWRYSR